MFKKILAMSVALVMLLALALPAFAAEGLSTPLVVGTSTLSEKFSPFYATTAYDTDIATMTQVALMTTDRVGGIIYNGIAGETVAYNGTEYYYQGIADLSVNFDEAANVTTYRATLRDDLVFSDGTPMTADDIIFNYYVFLDPAYVGSTQLASYGIIGVDDYRTQTTSDVYAKYQDIAAAIYAAGAAHTVTPEDAWTQEQQDGFWALLEQAWTADVQGIVDYVMANYLDAYAVDTLGYTPAEINESQGLTFAFGMALWGFGEMNEEGKFVTAVTGTEFDIANGEFPTLSDYVAETVLAYEGDAEVYYSVESAGGPAVLPTAINNFIAEYGPQDASMSGGIPNISGITKIDDYTVEIKTVGFEAPAVYAILGLQIAPLHYYGDVAQYDYDNNQFGHPYGDLTMVEAKTTVPVGAGPYTFTKYENRVVYYEANASYYQGAPKIQYMQFKETNSLDVVPGIQTGTIDISDLNGTKSNFNNIASINDNGEITGSVISTIKVDNRGYGYIGINALNVNVGGISDSDASKDLRKALATVFAVYRDTAYNSYYGEAASVIQYPISNTSWAAPQPTDPDFKPAFSVDVDGNPIYTAEMLPEEKYAVANAAAIGFLKAAGFTFDDATGKFVAAPEGAKLSYEIIIPGDGQGDHPSFAVLTDAQAAFATFGIDLVINDPANSNELWNALDAGTQELWCAAWQSTIDPDMYQVYYGKNILGGGGADSNRYGVTDAELDTLIVNARMSGDQGYRKELYKRALSIIVDWAVEVPAYQRQNCTVFSTVRVDMDAMTPDLTTYYGWGAEVQNVLLAQ